MHLGSPRRQFAAVVVAWQSHVSTWHTEAAHVAGLAAGFGMGGAFGRKRAVVSGCAHRSSGVVAELAAFFRALEWERFCAHRECSQATFSGSSGYSARSALKCSRLARADA